MEQVFGLAMRLCEQLATKSMTQTLNGEEVMCYHQCLNTLQIYMARWERLLAKQEQEEMKEEEKNSGNTEDPQRPT